MKNFAKIENNTVVSIIQTTKNPDKAYIEISSDVDLGWVYDPISKTFSDPGPIPNPVISHLEFLRRFTPTERTQLRTAAKADPILDDAMYLFERAQEISVEDPDTINFVDYMISQSLLDPTRRANILAYANQAEIDAFNT